MSDEQLFLQSERQYGYRTPDGATYRVVPGPQSFRDPKKYAEKKARKTGGVVLTRTATTFVTPWADVTEEST